MRIIPLKEVGQMEPGEVVPAMRCQIKEVGEPKSGTNTYGDWTMQTLTVMDQTAVTKIKLFDCPVYDAQWVGLWIQVESTPDDKGKLRGIMVSSYKDKKEIQVKSNAGAKIEQVTDETPEPAQTAPQPAKAPAPVRTAPAVQATVRPSTAQQNAPRAVQTPNQASPNADQTRKVIADAKYKLAQSANAMTLAYGAALHCVNQVLKNNPELTSAYFSPDIIQKIAVSFLIDLNKSGLVSGLPAGPLEGWLKKPQPPQPQEPEQAAEPDPDDVPMEF